MREGIHIPQEPVRHRPADNRYDAFITLLATVYQQHEVGACAGPPRGYPAPRAVDQPGGACGLGCGCGRGTSLGSLTPGVGRRLSRGPRSRARSLWPRGAVCGNGIHRRADDSGCKDCRAGVQCQVGAAGRDTGFLARFPLCRRQRRFLVLPATGEPLPGATAGEPRRKSAERSALPGRSRMIRRGGPPARAGRSPCSPGAADRARGSAWAGQCPPAPRLSPPLRS